MIKRAVVIGACLLLGAPAGARGQSLWRDGAMGTSLFLDARARAVNDIVTILIVEQSSSSRSANTKVDESTSRAAGVNRFPTIFDPIAGRFLAPVLDPIVGYQRPSEALKQRLAIDLSGSASHEGKGAIDRADRVSGQIAARVVKVLDNGNLLLEGRRAVLVNGETQVITVSGLVRPQDVTAANTVLSSQIADAEIQMVGHGVLADAQRPGLLYRLFNWLKLF